jgi:hypothetical protein
MGLLDHLRDSQFSGDGDIKAMVKEFDERAKLTFRKGDEPLAIRFGGFRDTDLSKGIRSGQLKLAGHVRFSVLGFPVTVMLTSIPQP